MILCNFGSSSFANHWHNLYECISYIGLPESLIWDRLVRDNLTTTGWQFRTLVILPASPMVWFKSLRLAICAQNSQAVRNLNKINFYIYGKYEYNIYETLKKNNFWLLIITRTRTRKFFFAILVNVLQFELHLTEIWQTFKLPLFILTTFFKLIIKRHF